MKHLIICREFPPAPSGGIGTYVRHISHLMAQAGETVHVIGQLWQGAEKKVEEHAGGRLIIHRIPLEDWTKRQVKMPHPGIRDPQARALFFSDFYPQAFGWQAGLLAEKLVQEEDIDLVEAQEYEAPLYFFQLRRALGLGPKKKPPCLVHLHSPTEWIAFHNDWNMAAPEVLLSMQLEAYSISAADGLLCPSRFLATQAVHHFALPEGSIQVIPLPVGDNTPMDRMPKVWQNGTVLYIGRLEKRKGILEWIQAAVSVAHEHQGIIFEFVGENVLGNQRMSSTEMVTQLVPRHLEKQFRFYGQQDHSLLRKFMIRARLFVVPSRWENFPNTCVEAMVAGLPVIASRQGGTTEMICHKESGWLVDKADAFLLAEALKEALATPVLELAKMGARAYRDIQRMCNNQRIIEKQLEFRTRIVKKGADHSIHLPLNLPWIHRPPVRPTVAAATKGSSESGCAVIVTCMNGGIYLENCLLHLEKQSRPPLTVIMIVDRSQRVAAQWALKKAAALGWEVWETVEIAKIAVLWNKAVEEIRQKGENPAAFVFLDSLDQPAADFIQIVEKVFKTIGNAGFFWCWNHFNGQNPGYSTDPLPAFPFQILTPRKMAPFAVRGSALIQAGLFRLMHYPGYEAWDLANALMARNWVAVTYPAFLNERLKMKQRSIYSPLAADLSRVYWEALERIPEVVTHAGNELAFLLESRLLDLGARRQPFVMYKNLRPREIFQLNFYQQVELARKVLKHPDIAYQYGLRHAKEFIRRKRRKNIK
jgi:glycogen(starch) synthase